VILEWGKKFKGKVSMFELAAGLGIKIEASAIDVDFIRKEQIRKAFGDLQDAEHEIKKTLE